MCPKPGRRWFAFRLRTVFVLVAVLSVALAWFSSALRWYNERANASKTMQLWCIGPEHTKVPLMLRPLGFYRFGGVSEVRCLEIDREKAVRLFPEARIVVVSSLRQSSLPATLSPSGPTP
jgi:hypothetical protein